MAQGQTLKPGTDVTALMSGQDVTALMTPTPAHEPAQPSTREAFAQGLTKFMDHLAASVNPLPVLKQLYADASEHPVAALAAGPAFAPLALSKHIGDAQLNEFKAAKQAYDKGDMPEAIRRTIAGAVPIVGPIARNIYDEVAQGEVAAAAGDLTGFAAPLLLGRVGVKVPGLKNPNPLEAAAVEFGQKAGIPIDAGTATGNTAVKAAQYLADRSIGGSLVSGKARQAQAQGLATVGEQLAAKSHPSPITPEQAGEGLRGAIKTEIGAKHAEASAAYDELRQIEAAQAQQGIPGFHGSPNSKLGVVSASPTARQFDNATSRLGAFFSPSELEAQRYAGAAKGQPSGRVYQTVVPLKNPYVMPWREFSKFQDINKAADGASLPSAKWAAREKELITEATDLRRSLEAQGHDGIIVQTAKGRIEEIASFADVPVEPIGIPVDLRAAKATFRPILARFQRQMPITQQQASPGLKALDNIVNGPDVAPLSQVDADLSAIKSIARGADMPELRDVSQGLAAGAVKQLDAAVRAAAAKAGPNALKALERGRAATVAKYGAADVLEQMRTEPVQAFDQATWAKDAGIERLRSIAKLAPNEMPKVGRAYLDDLLAKATAEGGFGKAGTIAQRWQNLGPETKKLMFPDPAHVSALDNFFLLAKRIADNPNPSGTSQNVAMFTQGGMLVFDPIAGGSVQLGAVALSKLLRNPTAVRALTNGFRIGLGNKTAATAAANSILRWFPENALVSAHAEKEK